MKNLVNSIFQSFGSCDYLLVQTVIIILLASFISSAKVIYVNPDAKGSKDGSSWNNAFTDLQSALHASSSGDSIWVAKGTYYPASNADKSISFRIPNGVKVFGGFAGGEISFSSRNYTNNVTTLSGVAGTSNNGSYIRSYHVVNFSNTGSSTVLDGFTIKGGWADTTIPATLDSLGGGILIYSTKGNMCSPVINNCIITDNFASYEGGGVCIYSESGGNSSPIFKQCKISGNKGILEYYGVIIIDTSFNLTNINEANAVGEGGGVAIDASKGSCNPEFNECYIVHNRDVLGGGGIYNYEGSPVINNCKISYNGDISYSYLVAAGGGIYSIGGTLKITGCTISYDSASFDGSSGGGIFIYGRGSTVLNLANDTISYSSATGGGGISINADSGSKVTGDIKNCVIINNAAFEGGGIFNFTSDSSMIDVKTEQCKINYNKAFREGGGIKNGNLGNSLCVPVFTNCIITGNSVNNKSGNGGGIYNNDGSCPALLNCTISEDSASAGGGIYNSLFNAGNTNMKPIFTGCIISGNYASIKGGGISSMSAVDTLSVSLTNCIVSGNYADTLGGGIYNYSAEGGYNNLGISDSGSVVNSVLMNCTITGNYAGLKGGGIYNQGSKTEFCITKIKNSIIWENEAGYGTLSANSSVFDSSASAAFSYSIIENSEDNSADWIASIGTNDGHNIDRDPLFKSTIDPSSAPSAGGDFHIKSGSPALGAGSPVTDAGVPATDISGNPRPFPSTGTNVDIGAYEENNTATKVKNNGSQRPKKFELEQNYPNPFNPSTIISYSLPKSENVRIEVFNLLGEKVATLLNEHEQQGNYKVSWNAGGLASGIYLYRLTAGSYILTKKMILLK